MATLSLDGVTKRFGATTAIKALSLDIANGEFVVLVGPSGCGKSTLLRMIAGLETITAGDLRIDGKRANDTPPQRRNISMVFQSYALFPHMSVYDNIAFGPEVRGEAKDDIARRIEKAAGILNLTPQLDRRPAQLSGGQRQRVAMGRAIVRDPAVFLFDEPLSNLDAKLRVQMRTEIKALHQALKTTIVYVTHDQIEAMTMADRIVVMNDGRIEQTGAPLEIYDRPANRFVAEFIGSPAMGILEGRYDRGAGAVRLDDAEAPLRVGDYDAADGARVAVGIRPECFARRAGGPIRFDVAVVEPTGPEIQVFGRIGATEMRALFRDREIPDVGQALHLDVAPEHVHLFDADTGARL